MLYFNKMFLKQNQGFIICIKLAIDHLSLSLSLSVPACLSLQLFTEVLRDQGDQWSHHCWVSHLLPGAEAQFREASAPGLARMVVVGGGSRPSLLFLGQAMGVPPGEAFTKNREILEGSKAGLLSRIPAHPRMDPRLWKVRSIFFMPAHI